MALPKLPIKFLENFIYWLPIVLQANSQRPKTLNNPHGISTPNYLDYIANGINFYSKVLKTTLMGDFNFKLILLISVKKAINVRL